MSPWRLIRSGRAPGTWNMAADQFLLEQAASGAGPALRLYGWDRPTLSLGYFQSLDEIPPAHRERFTLVRRPTGGGAILHDRELTYAAAVPREQMEGAELYERTNRAILRAVRALGVEAEVRGKQHAARAQRGPFFCFARSGATDIIARSRKLAGSAQRRRGRGVLQHGSILLATHEDGAVGVNELLGREVGLEELGEQLARAVEEVFGAVFTPRDFEADERAEIERIRQRRYGTTRWLTRGNRKVRT